MKKRCKQGRLKELWEIQNGFASYICSNGGSQEELPVDVVTMLDILSPDASPILPRLTCEK